MVDYEDVSETLLRAEKYPGRSLEEIHGGDCSLSYSHMYFISSSRQKKQLQFSIFC